jgi:hypothetical protein
MRRFSGNHAPLRGIIPWLAFGIGALALWLILLAGWGVEPWAVAQAGLAQHYTLVADLRRYEWWIGWNLVDLLVYGGWPTLLGFTGAIWLSWRSWRARALAYVDLLAVALALFVLILDLSGSTRGETGRLWIFFMPLLALPAANFWNAVMAEKSQWLLLAVGLQLLLALCIAVAWRPVRALIVVAERPPSQLGSAQTTLDVPFLDEPIRLRGFTLDLAEVADGGDLGLTLFWSAAGPASRPYTVFAHVVDEAGNLVAQKDNWPVDGRWPPTCWRAGEEIVDPVRIALPPELPPGNLSVIAGLYDAQTGIRLPLAGGGDSILLETLRVSDSTSLYLP